MALRQPQRARAYAFALAGLVLYLLANAFVGSITTTGGGTRPHHRRPYGKEVHGRRLAAANIDFGGRPLCVFLIWTVVAEAAGDDGQERVLLFNTRGLAVSMSATGALFFARTALTKFSTRTRVPL